MSPAAEPIRFDDLADLYDWATAVEGRVELSERTPTADVYTVRSDHATAECRVPLTPEDAALRRLNAEHAGLWRIWRSSDEHGRPAAWVATNIGVPRAAPTLHETSLERLEARLKSPPPGFAGPLTALTLTD